MDKTPLAESTYIAPLNHKPLAWLDESFVGGSEQKRVPMFGSPMLVTNYWTKCPISQMDMGQSKNLRPGSGWLVKLLW
ncbi:hypothetical protein BC938DRAFT_477445 [Jimgerdemannia flammicorona]|uniref:Uncharacterized protein n=1 Tax=Jimgerdemannia flammicorona TaxID=994334 RepID=A0A433P9P2_9FUNG|nr:hypothetical protein BC938DRAFT_477445 [Jimgerdemannia flammicorona]